MASGRGGRDGSFGGGGARSGGRGGSFGGRSGGAASGRMSGGRSYGGGRSRGVPSGGRRPSGGYRPTPVVVPRRNRGFGVPMGGPVVPRTRVVHRGGGCFGCLTTLAAMVGLVLAVVVGVIAV